MKKNETDILMEQAEKRMMELAEKHIKKKGVGELNPENKEDSDNDSA